MAVLTLRDLKAAAREFATELGANAIPDLYGVTDGKKVGTYIEQAFHRQLARQYSYIPGSSALGIDLPELEVDIKTTSIRQPQSSCPYRDAGQKVYGLGYHLLIFVYDKSDDHSTRSARLDFREVIFVAHEQTGDYQTTYGLRGILQRNGNRDDVMAFLEERNLPLDDIGREQLADRIMRAPPELGYLTISNSLQWRLQYGRVITLAAAGDTAGVENLLE